MAKKKQRTTQKKKSADAPQENDLSTGDISEQPLKGSRKAGSQQAPKYIGVADVPFEPALDELADTFKSNVTDKPIDPASEELPTISIRHKHLSIIQKILIGCITLIVTMLLYILLKSLSMSTGKQIPAAQKPAPSTALIEQSTQKEPQQDQKSKMGLSSTKSLSLKTAETFYLQKDFDKAYNAYNQLRQDLPDDGQEDLMRDLLQLKMAFCRKNAGDFDQADPLFRAVSESRCPIVRAVANYLLCLLEMQKEQYLKAQTRAYQTMALISALTFNWQWTLSLEQNCQFLVAESMTRHVLAFCDADKDCPAELWPDALEADPFTNLSEAELRRLLNSGSEQLRGAVLSPQIEKVDQQGSLARWSVICNGASIEELLARFAANADLDIQWIYPAPSSIPGRDTQDEKRETRDDKQGTYITQAVRDRPVSLYMSAATTQQIVKVAAGCAGLLAQLDDKGTVTIFNPFEYASLSEHTALLAQEAVSLWQKFLLTSDDKERIPNAHFALGLLQVQRGCLTDAIAEYKLVANRYSRTSIAPYALLASSKLKVELHDYLGAREDLKQLTEQYPEGSRGAGSPGFSDQACLYLADVTIKAGLLSEAAQLYRKVYNLGFSLESQRASALGAGKCFYEEKDYENAAKWLTQYINLGSAVRRPGDRKAGSLAEDRTDRDFYLACFLLGKTFLAQNLPQQACNAFESALGGLAGQNVMQEYVETVSALVKAHIQQGHFVEALKLLENTSSWQLSQKESIEILLLKASTLRSMGLVDEAITVLGDKAEYLLDSQLKAKISFEQAKCLIAKDNLELARKKLSEILVLVEPGPLAHEAGCELADVCLKLGQDSQAISICFQLLDSAPANTIQQRALNLLATTYTKQKNYDQAALAYLGQWPGQSDK